MILKEQDGKIIYSDGETTEQNMLEIAERYPDYQSADFISKDSKYTINNTFSLVRHNILNWYDFNPDSEILEIGAGMGSITGMLAERCKNITAVEMNKARSDVIRARFKDRKNISVISDDITRWNSDKRFDYIVVIGVLEYAAVFSDSKNPFVDFLTAARKLLKQNGKLLLAIENRFGLKYWCGASEDHLQEPWVGIDGYIKPRTPRTFSKAELEKLMKDSGFSNHRFYNVLPDYKFPQLIFTDDADISFNSLANIHFTYSKNSTITINQIMLYKDIIENNKLDFFANSYLIEMSQSELNNIYPKIITLRGESLVKYKTITKIMSDETVIKEAAIVEAKEHIKNLNDNMLNLSDRGITLIPSTYENDKIYMPYISYKKADDIFLEKLIAGDINGLYTLIDKLKDAILKSSDITTEKNIYETNIDASITNDRLGVILKDGYIDMAFYNAFYNNGDLIFYDQEWKFHNLPLNFILHYAVKSVFSKYKYKDSETERLLYRYIGSIENSSLYETLENYIWSTVLARSGDIYGEDGYCNQYSDDLSLERKFGNLKNTISNNEVHISDLNYNIETLQQDVAMLKQEINQKDNHIHAIQSTKGYRILELCRRITKRLLPHGSMRRGFAKYIYKILKFNYKALRYLYRNGVIATVKKSIQLFFKKKSDDEFIPKLDVDLSVPKKVSFDYSKDPIVSIIIPVYNQFDYTMRCLDSIRKNSGDIQYEIILADDMSDDQTQNIQNFTENIVIVRNEVNLKFLKNCNNAVKYARGEFILFLNNDTIVMENWLRPLIDILVNDKSVGLVGSKLIYPDGRLQEAGGIIWADASGWNYGRGSNPTSSEYNYLRDVDYISGASIAISKQLWEEIGGFDERFAPAYYEDSDLAFEVKKRNLRVVYQPLSSVVHFEGVSHGCDINVGLKAYQIENKDKFFQKWKDTLAKENFPNAENLFLARDKSMSKKTILYVDHYVPRYDRDAGSRNTLSNLQILVSLGYNVKFLGDNFFQDEPYTTKLEQMGIEVLYGNYYAQNWKSWIKNNAKYINYALLSRPHIAPKYIDIIREFTDAKIIYHPHDLHYIRTMREYEITGDKELILKAEQLKKTELSLINKSDVTITVSSFEKEELKKLLPEKEVIVIPIYHYEKFNEIIKEFSNKRNLLFVGGFTHTPNEDGLLWFMNEVFSLVKAKLPEVKLYIVGSNPTDKVRSLISKDVMLESNVPDERLEELYSGCRVAIIPLRYGAGVKGKTIEAMSKCIGVVSTYVGLEGIEEIEKFQKPFDTPEDFSNQIIELYLDDEKLYKNINDNQECLKRFYTTEKAREIFKKVLR